MAWRTGIITVIRAALTVPRGMRYPVSIAGTIVLVVVVWLAARMLYASDISPDSILLISILLVTGLTMVAAGQTHEDRDRPAGRGDPGARCDDVDAGPCAEQGKDRDRHLGGRE